MADEGAIQDIREEADAMEKVKWGVLGTANIARSCTIPGMMLADNCVPYAIAGRSAEKAEAFRTEFAFEKAYTGYEALIADPDVQAVYIPLPNDLHLKWVKAALENGKHVLCEKPLALQRQRRCTGRLRKTVYFSWRRTHIFTVPIWTVSGRILLRA